ncbi:DUF3987 domain-containing protein, partial [Novosphingobium indicum]|uniref:DUF3987 domain-containing protein n=1 Tax=Novosphingobium indicum TaxID=462949 RepID=UPI001669A964
MCDFPLELLPDTVQRAISAQVSTAKYPVEAVGTAALAVICHAAQGLRNIDSLHTTGGSYPLSEFFMVLARSGDAKSSVFQSFMNGIIRWQDRQRLVYDEDIIDYIALKKVWDRDCRKAEKDGCADQFRSLERERPVKPLNPDNVLSKATTNGIFRTLETGWPALGIFTGEGGSLLGGHSLRAENSPTEFASMLTTVWDGGTVDRSTGEVTVRLPGRRISALIMVQPEVAEAFLADPKLKPHGIHARFLIVSPPAWSPPQANFLDDVDLGRKARLEEAMECFHDRIDWLLSRDLPVSEFDRSKLEPPILYWSKDAKAHMQEWFNSTCISWRNDGNPFFNRAFEHACRLAGALTVFANDTYVPLALAKAGTALVEFYADQLRGLDIGTPDVRHSDEGPIIQK